MRRTETKARALDAQARDSAAEGDRAQLRHAHRHHPKGQRGIDQMLVRRHSENLGGACLGVDVEHTVEGENIETG